MGDVFPVTLGRKIHLVLDSNMGILFKIQPVLSSAMGVPTGPSMEMLNGFPIRDPYQRVAAVILYSR